jgi:hypothetical protein
MMGERFGQLDVVMYADTDRWQCFCTCGNSVLVPAADLHGGHITSCGCQRESRRLVVGEKCGRLTVVEHRSGEAWECLCACGRIVNVLDYNLRTPASQSCGRCVPGVTA